MSRAAALLVLAVVVGIFLVVRLAPAVQTRAVPDVAGMAPEDAVVAVQEAGFDARVVPVCDPGAAAAVTSAYTIERNLWWSRATVVVDDLGVTDAGGAVAMGETVYLELPDRNACPGE